VINIEDFIFFSLEVLCISQPILQAVTLGWNIQQPLLSIDPVVENKKETSPLPVDFL
jgi:hypothetical protein